MAELIIQRGSTAIIRSTLSPASLVSGSNIYFMAKYNRTDPDSAVVIEKSSSDGITVTDADAGEIVVTIDPADTRALPNTDVRLAYEIEIEKSGAVYPVDEGFIQLTSECIQRALA